MTDAPVAVLVSTHDRIDDARINMEIVRAAWPQEFANVALVHAHNGRPGGWTPYLEDVLVEVAPGQSHFTGAGDLLDAGLAAIARDLPDVQHVVCIAADSWLYRPEGVRAIVDDMRRDNLRLAAASWEVADDAHGVRRERGDPALLPGAGLSTDAFVIDLPWALEFGMLPLDTTGFLATNGAILNYLQEIVLLEKYLEGRYLGAARSQLQRTRWPKDGWGSEGLRRARAMLRLIHERPIDPAGITAPSHKGHWPDLGLITIEDPIVKRAEVRNVEGLRGGPVLERFLHGGELFWFNAAQ
jgi:hypothetical protein